MLILMIHFIDSKSKMIAIGIFALSLRGEFMSIDSESALFYHVDVFQIFDGPINNILFK